MSNETVAIEKYAISKDRWNEELTIPASASTQGYVNKTSSDSTIEFEKLSNGKPTRKLIRFEFSND